MKRNLLLYSQVVSFAFCLTYTRCVSGQALNMDGQSGIFFQPTANVVPASPHRFNGPTLSYHMVTAGPVAGDYISAGLEQGFGNWLEFGFTRSNHTDGGNPQLSTFFNYAGMNIVNVKVKILPENMRRRSWVPAIAVGGVLRTNDPFISQSFTGRSSTNSDIYVVASKVAVIGKVLPILLNAGVRGTNAEVYGYGGNSTHWEARSFGALGFPIPIAQRLIVCPTFEIDQEPNRLKYLPTVSIPTSLIYAVRISQYPSMKWSIDIGTGHIGSHVAQGIDLKINSAIAIAFDYRF